MRRNKRDRFEGKEIIAVEKLDFQKIEHGLDDEEPVGEDDEEPVGEDDEEPVGEDKLGEIFLHVLPLSLAYALPQVTPTGD